jgi:hypothetical protein
MNQVQERGTGEVREWPPGRVWACEFVPCRPATMASNLVQLLPLGSAADPVAERGVIADGVRVQAAAAAPSPATGADVAAVFGAVNEQLSRGPLPILYLNPTTEHPMVRAGFISALRTGDGPPVATVNWTDAVANPLTAWRFNRRRPTLHFKVSAGGDVGVFLLPPL